jgi:DNA phosphorothioation-dependent restriction protein DptF
MHPLALELQKLRESSKYAVAHGSSHGLDDFREYLHIEREVELKLKERVKLCAQVDKAQLLLVCGNVGDGKSHILSHLNKSLKDEMALFKIHNDATESHNPNERSNQTLFKLLEGFQDENIERCKEKIILAINLGTLSNFLDEYGDKFNKLIRYVDDHNILDTDVVSEDEPGDGYFQHVNFTDYHMYSLTSSGPKSKIVTTLLERIVSDDPKNLLYEAYKKSKEIGIDNCPICLNYEFLQIKCNRDALVELVIQAIVKNKLIISLRALLNFFYDLLVPIDFKWEEIDSYKKQLSELKTSALLNAIIPNYIFEHPELSVVFDKMSKLDPCSLRYSALDLELIRLINSESPEKIFTEFIGTDSLSIVTIQLPELLKEKISSKVKNDTLTKSFIRLNFFSNHKDVMAKSDPYYLDYLTTLFEYNNHRKLALERIFNIVREAARKWYGDPNKRDKVVLRVGKKQSKYRVFKAFKAKPVIDKVPETENDELMKFVQEFTLRFKIDGAEDDSKIHIDYGLYKILNQINSGYLPNRRDNNNYLSFVGLINRLINQNNETSDLEIDTVNIGKASDFKLSKDDFGNYKFQTL